MVADVLNLDAPAAIAAIQAGRMSAGECVAALAARIEAAEPEIRAWQYFDPERAGAEAQKLEFAKGFGGTASGRPPHRREGHYRYRGYAHGERHGAGCRRRPAADAAVVRLLREAGAIVMGKTVTTELAFMQPSRTRNPRNLAHSPGGSSSGSAAAVAAGMVPVAIGTQTAGSVIRPAAFCGVYGLKPTYGLFPRAGVLEEAHSLDTVGVFANSLGGIAAVTQVLAKHYKHRPGPDYLRACRNGTPRFAFVKTPAWPLAENAAKAVFEGFADALGGACERVELPPSFDRAIEWHRTIMLSEMALNYAPYYERGKERLSAVLREAIEAGRQSPAVDYARALREREGLYRQLAALLAPYDAILTPSAPGPAPRGFETTGNPIFCSIWTYLGVPALNLPLLELNGLPLGVQLVGLRFDEERLLGAAAWLLSHASAPNAGS